MKTKNRKKAEIPCKIKGFSLFYSYLPVGKKGTKIPFLSCYRKDLVTLKREVLSYDVNAPLRMRTPQ